MALRRVAPVAVWLALSTLWCAAASAYGPKGHLIAGRAAAAALCPQATAEITRLGGGQDLGEIGLWADRIRSEAAYAASGPWHYMNIADGVPLARYTHPPEGDVLWAIDRFSARLGDERLDEASRAEALRFLVHFIVDVHQPLHVGRADDRGGNEIDLRFDGEATNLHRLWDTQAIDWTGLTVKAYVRAVEGLMEDVETGPSLDPLVWAGESLALRDRVYAFGRAGREPSKPYMDFAARVTRERLALAAGRLAGTLNAIFCG